jgi:hypothetical protein
LSPCWRDFTGELDDNKGGILKNTINLPCRMYWTFSKSGFGFNEKLDNLLCGRIYYFYLKLKKWLPLCNITESNKEKESSHRGKITQGRGKKTIRSIREACNERDEINNQLYQIYTKAS